MIHIGGVPAGLLGIDELFNELFDLGATPENDDIGKRLMTGIKKHNFVPKPAQEDYQQTLVREYRAFYQNRTGNKKVGFRDYGTWEGHPREHIPWFPVVSPDLCNGCEQCLEVCPKDVFEMDENSKAVVAEPFLCIVGCCFCKSACDPKAILMPDREMLNQYRHGQRQQT
jgi:NAD-dependent dihydropyrimidine dehydrogenase PreA subunit